MGIRLFGRGAGERRRIPGWVWMTMVFLAAGGVGTAVGAWHNLCANCPSIAQIHTYEPQQASKIYAVDGRLISDRIGDQRRTPVAIADLPPHVPQAFIAIEDKRFYQHDGLDLRGIGRAVLGVVRNRSLSGGGGSTITQQLARNMWTEELGFEKRLVRKLKEWQVARELEGAYSKDEILEAYMNQIGYAHGWYGLQTASANYFGKNAIHMNPAEGALLAAIANLPEHYTPLRHPDAAISRRNLVLELMAQQGYLTREDADHWKQEDVPRERARSVDNTAPYFVEMVRRILDDRFGARLYTAGLEIHTTLDLDMQAAAEAAMHAGWTRIEERPGFRHTKYAEFSDSAGGANYSDIPYVQGMFVASDPRTGHIRALIGGRDYGHSKFNRATQARRQAGSSFKPILYTAAIESRIPASEIIQDAPVVIEQADGTKWRPENYYNPYSETNTFDGPMTMREGLYRSKNMIAIRLARDRVGLEAVAQMAQRLGIRTEVERFPSTAIGAAEVIPIQMLEAYSTLATRGWRVRPFPITRVESADGEVLWEPKPERERVLDPLDARVAASLLEDVVENPEGTGHRGIRGAGATGAGLPRDVPAAGKTGTTNDGADAWFIGFTPDLAAAVWFGMDRPVPIAPGATGGGVAAPVWGDFMRRVYYDDVPDEGDNEAKPGPLLAVPGPWPLPDGLIQLRVDSKTGHLASRWCPDEDAYDEVYLPGTEPTTVCDRQGEVFELRRRP